MNELLVIVRQIVIMFLLMSVGFFIYKKKMIDDHSTKQLTDIVLYVVNPALSLVSFQQSFSVDKLVGFMIVFVLSFATIFLGIFVGKIVIGKDFKLEQYACGFSNAGFYWYSAGAESAGCGICVLYVGILGCLWFDELDLWFISDKWQG